MNIQEIVLKYGISLYKDNGELKNSIEILEDIYLKVSPHRVSMLFNEIQEEEIYKDVFKVKA